MNTYSMLTHKLTSFVHAEEGSIAVQFGLASVALIGLMGLAADFAGAINTQARLQATADTAAIAGAKVLAAEGTAAEAESAAENHLTNGSAAGIDFEKVINVSVANEEVTISLSSEHPSMVRDILRGHTMDIGVDTAARLGPPNGPPICLHALHPTMNKAFNSTGGTSVSAPECDVYVNSTSGSSVTMTGGGSISAHRACIHGGVASGTITPEPEDCGYREDPFASMSPATTATCAYTNFSPGSGNITLSPGVYCGGLTLNGGPTVTLQPGTYVIRNGPLKMSGGSMTGTGVTFVFEGSATVDLAGSGSYHLVAPTSGDFKSFVFFQRPSASPNAIASMKGGGDTYFEGIIYFPTWETVITGGGTVETPSPFSAYIAKNFRATGGSAISLVYDPDRITIPVPWQLFLEPRTIYLSQ